MNVCKSVVITNGNCLARLILDDFFQQRAEYVSGFLIVTGDYRACLGLRALWEAALKNVIDAASLVPDSRPDIRFDLASDGVEEPRLKEIVAPRGQYNVPLGVGKMEAIFESAVRTDRGGIRR